MKRAQSVAVEISRADQEQQQLSEDIAEQKSGVATTKSFFSSRLGLGPGSIAPTGRAKCYSCKNMIPKGSVRFEWFWNKLRPNAFVHSYCVPTISKQFQLVSDTLEQLGRSMDAAASSNSNDPVRQEAIRLLNSMRPS